MNKPHIAIVTGASGGLGKEFVKLLLEEETIETVWALARRTGKLDALKERYGERVKTFSIDLSDRHAILKFQENLRGVQIDYLVNNAGYAKFCSYEDLTIEESLNMIDVNCGAVVAIGLVCLPHMEKDSHIINIASQASFQPLPYQNIYSATKAFVRSYSRALNAELKEKGVLVCAVCPGWIKTELYERALIGAKRATHNFCGMVEPSDVAKKAMHDAKCGRDISVYSAYTKFSHLLAKLLPEKLMIKIWLRQQKLN